MKGSVEKGDKSGILTIEKTAIKVWGCTVVNISFLEQRNSFQVFYTIGIMYIHDYKVVSRSCSCSL